MFDFIRNLFRRKSQSGTKPALVLKHDNDRSAVPAPSTKIAVANTQPRSIFARQAPSARKVERVPNDNRRRAKWDDTEREFVEINEDTAKRFADLYVRSESVDHTDNRSSSDNGSDSSTDD